MIATLVSVAIGRTHALDAAEQARVSLTRQVSQVPRWSKT